MLWKPHDPHYHRINLKLSSIYNTRDTYLPNVFFRPSRIGSSWMIHTPICTVFVMLLDKRCSVRWKIKDPLTTNNCAMALFIWFLWWNKIASIFKTCCEYLSSKYLAPQRMQYFSMAIYFCGHLYYLWMWYLTCKLRKERSNVLCKTNGQLNIIH